MNSTFVFRFSNTRMLLQVSDLTMRLLDRLSIRWRDVSCNFVKIKSTH
jgi:hypothetical protein